MRVDDRDAVLLDISATPRDVCSNDGGVSGVDNTSDEDEQLGDDGEEEHDEIGPPRDIPCRVGESADNVLVL